MLVKINEKAAKWSQKKPINLHKTKQQPAPAPLSLNLNIHQVRPYAHKTISVCYDVHLVYSLKFFSFKTFIFYVCINITILDYSII